MNPVSERCPSAIGDDGLKLELAVAANEHSGDVDERTVSAHRGHADDGCRFVADEVPCLLAHHVRAAAGARHIDQHQPMSQQRIAYAHKGAFYVLFVIGILRLPDVIVVSFLAANLGRLLAQEMNLERRLRRLAISDKDGRHRARLVGLNWGEFSAEDAADQS